MSQSRLDNYSENLTRNERLQLLALAQAEVRSRGLKMSPDEEHRKASKPYLNSHGYFIRQDGREYTPTEAQKAFIDSTAKFNLFVGGRGSGKTAAGIQKALKKILQGESGAVLTPDFEQFRFSTWPELAQWIPWERVVRHQRSRRSPSWEPYSAFTLVFTNGARMMCKGLKDPESARGPNINWLWYDEAGRDRTGMGWKIAIAGVRVGKNPQAWSTTTPKGKRHWLYNFFAEQRMDPEVMQAFGIKDVSEVIRVYQGSIEDNRTNLDGGFYASMMMAYGRGWLADQELKGLFVDPGGALADRVWFKIVTAAPSIHDFERVVRFWDLAATEKETEGDDPDYTAGALVGYKDGRIWIMDMLAVQARWKTVNDLIVQTAMLDGKNVAVRIEQEPGASGKRTVEEITALPGLLGYDVRGYTTRGRDKVVRANPWFAQAQAGNVYLLQDQWNDDFLDEVEGFPGGAHDDRVDAVSGAVDCLGIEISMKELEASQARIERTRWQTSSKLDDSGLLTNDGRNGHEPNSPAGDGYGPNGNSDLPNSRWRI